MIIVVDNGSGDGSLERIESWGRSHFGPSFARLEGEPLSARRGRTRAGKPKRQAVPSRPGFVLIGNHENLGYDGGNNVGIRYALGGRCGADYVLILNNDVEIGKDCLRVMTDVAMSQNAGIVGAVIVDKESRRVQFGQSGSFFSLLFTIKGVDRLPQRQDIERAFWRSPRVCGAAMLLTKEVLETIRRMRGEYLNSKLFAYQDELDLCCLAARCGFPSLMAGEAIAYHRNDESQHSHRKSSFFHYYFTRNSILVARDLFPFHQRILFHALYLPLVLRRAAKMVMLHKNVQARAILSGFMDGYKGLTGKWRYHDSGDWTDETR